MIVGAKEVDGKVWTSGTCTDECATSTCAESLINGPDVAQQQAVKDKLQAANDVVAQAARNTQNATGSSNTTSTTPPAAATF